MKSPRPTVEELSRTRTDLESLQEANRLKDDLLAVLGQEVLTPLSSIVGFASMLEDGVAGPLNPGQQAFLAGISEGAERLQSILNNALTMGRLISGKYALRISPVDYLELVRSEVDSLADSIRRKHMRAEILVDVPVPVHVDREGIQLALRGLVENCLKIGQEGRSIQIRGRVEGDRLVAEVHTGGPPIPGGQVEDMFKPFHRLDASNTRSEGSISLGLSLCKAVVEAHRGSIGVHAGVQDGNLFWFTLPLNPPGEQGEGFLQEPKVANL